MSIDTLILIAFLTIALYIFYHLLKNQFEKPKQDPTLNAWLKSLQQSFDTTNRTTTSSLQQNYKELFARLDQATSVISDLKKEAGAFGEVSKSMKNLQELLLSPKLRGNISEQVLSDLLAQVFPATSILDQYHFKSGAIVDVALKTKGGLLPIDAKFPAENFQKLLSAQNEKDKTIYRNQFIRDTHKHLKDISNKYLLPEEGTLDFALMYVPSESVYYEIVNASDLMEQARTLRVFPVSPTTLYAHLQVILLSLESEKIAAKSKAVLSLLRSVEKDYLKHTESIDLLGKHLTNAYNTLNSTRQTSSQLGQKLDSIKLLKSTSEDAPKLEVLQK